LKFCFKIIGQSQFGPSGQLAQPAHSGTAKPTRLGSGSVNRPSPAPLGLLSLSSFPLAIWIAAAAWPLRPTPVASAVASLGGSLASAPSTSSTEWNRRPPPLRGDPWKDPARNFASLLPPSSIPRRLLPDACCASLRRSQCVCTPVEAPSAVLPVHLDEVLPSAAPSRPRGHCLAMPARDAPGRLVSVIFLFYLCPLSLATLSDQLVKNSEPSSQILLCAAAA
jgi:hypothetical protein